MTKEPLYHRIQRFYDRATPLWEAVWGEHLHHGFYGPDGRRRTDPYRAQVDLIEALLRWAEVAPAQRILDVGCGVGGSALYLLKHLNAQQVVGVTLSPVQARRAQQRAAEAGAGERAHFLVADALAPPLAPEQFDLVWALESGEHMPDKRRFIQACVDMLAPGGVLVVATWCHRPVPPPLTSAEKGLLQRLYRRYHLPGIISLPEYAHLAEAAGLSRIRIADWSAAVAPFWKEVLRSALRWKSLIGLWRAGWETVRGALAIPLMIRGYRTGLIRYGVLRGEKR
ncbi:MAG: methyltransferase domain-containing protein [Calditrichaeota bacterium]|nr:MAG: methyltransferase domain-containing protein [Calditrichota bacterium]